LPAQSRSAEICSIKNHEKENNAMPSFEILDPDAEAEASREVAFAQRLGTIAEIDAVLDAPCSVRRRAELVRRRIELDQSAKSAAAHQKFVGNLIVNAPDNEGTLYLPTRTVNAEIIDGRRVFRLLRTEFDILSADVGENGSADKWLQANLHLAGV
jgi:hypothetical protein